jgi:hypothetical protein
VIKPRQGNVESGLECGGWKMHTSLYCATLLAFLVGEKRRIVVL